MIDIIALKYYDTFKLIKHMKIVGNRKGNTWENMY